MSKGGMSLNIREHDNKSIQARFPHLFKFRALLLGLSVGMEGKSNDHSIRFFSTST
jgi:hypothetical protein